MLEDGLESHPLHIYGAYTFETHQYSAINETGPWCLQYSCLPCSHL